MSKKRKKPHRVKKRKSFRQMASVKAPLIHSVVGVIGCLAFGALLVFCPKDDLPLLLAAGGLFLLSLTILIAALNIRIDFDSNGFTHRNFFRRSRHYSYKDVTAVRFGKSTVVYMGKRKCTVEEDYVHRKDFNHALSIHATHAKRTESRLFGGNVENPEEFVFIFWFGWIAMLLMLAMAWFGGGRPPQETDLASMTVTLERCVVETDEDGDEDLLLYAKGYTEPFRIWYPEDVADLPRLQTHAAQQGSVEISYDKRDLTEADVRENGAVVQRLTAGEHTFLSLESMQRQAAEVDRILLIAALVITLFWWGFAAVFTYVTTHAERYPRLVRFFVKEDYLRKKPPFSKN